MGHSLVSTLARPATLHRPNDRARSQAAFGQAANDCMPRLIIGGGIGGECVHGKVSAIGQSNNGDVVSAQDDWLAPLRQVHRITKRAVLRACVFLSFSSSYLWIIP